MKPKQTLAGAVLLALAGCADPAPGPAPVSAVSSPPAVTAPAVATVTAADMYARIGLLAHDSMRGRDTPSPGLERTAAYLVSEYQRLGLEPAGEEGTYYQRYPLRTFGLDMESAHFGTVLADGSQNQMLEYGTDFFALPGVGVVGGDMNHARLAYVGSLAPSGLPAGDYAGTVPIVQIPGGYSADWRAEVGRARLAALEAGATAVAVIVDPAFPEPVFRQLATVSRAPREALGDDPELAVFYLTSGAFERIAARMESGGRLASTGAMVPLTGGESHFAANRRIIQDARPPNVVAMLRGSDPVLRDEYVVLSAHMDHVGVGAPADGDSIYNGADDNASGTAALLEVAEAMASLPTPPRRSIIFLHVSGEEKGLLGSRWYSDNPTVPIDAIVANMNVDMIARNSPDTVVVIGKNYSTLGRTVDQVQARHPELGLTLSDDLWPEERFFYRSDHFNFARKDIPSIFFFSGVHEDYHRPSDEVQRLDTDKAARIARIIFYTVDAVANDPARPRWDPRGLAEVRALTR